MRGLLVEDDEMIGQSLRDALDANGWSVGWVKDGLLAQSALEDGDYACVLLDLGLPKRDGVEVLRKARSQGNQTPVLVLTARDGLDDRVAGLDIGADDYLVKPYEFRELLARMRAAIRRRDGSAHSVIGRQSATGTKTVHRLPLKGFIMNFKAFFAVAALATVAAVTSTVVRADEADRSQYVLKFDGSRTRTEVMAEAATVSATRSTEPNGSRVAGPTRSSVDPKAVRAEAAQALRLGQIPSGEAGRM